MNISVPSFFGLYLYLVLRYVFEQIRSNSTVVQVLISDFIPSLTFEPGSGILGTFFHVKSRAPVEGCDATALFRLAKRGTARDEANSCPLQKNRHFLTLASFLAGQLKTIPEMQERPMRARNREIGQGEVYSLSLRDAGNKPKGSTNPIPSTTTTGSRALPLTNHRSSWLPIAHR